MNIRLEADNVIIEGLVRGNTEVAEIKSVISNLVSSSKIVTIQFENSYVIPSSLIGFLLKVIHDDKINLTVKVKQKELYDLLDRLNLVSALNVSKV